MAEISLGGGLRPVEERYIKNLSGLTEGDCGALRQKKVLVAGCGGIGGYALDMLLRLGLGEIAVADGDRFEPSNLNRQLLCTDEVMGASKAEAAGAYAARLNPRLRFTAYNEYVTEANAAAMTEGCDAVLDALDSIPARRLLKAECDRQGIPYIYGAVSGWMAQAALSMPGDGLLERLYPEGVDAAGADGALPFAAAMCAAIQCSLCVRLLCGKDIDSGRLYFFDLREPELATVF